MLDAIAAGAANSAATATSDNVLKLLLILSSMDTVYFFDTTKRASGLYVSRTYSLPLSQKFNRYLRVLST
jgi:hypothetical protein